MHLELGNHGVALLDDLDGITNELVNDSLGGLLLVDNGSALAHEEGAESLKRVVILIVAEVLDANLGGELLAAVIGVEELVEVSLVGDGALGSELLHLGLALRLPVVDVRVVADAHGTAGEDDGADVVVVARGADSLLVGAGSAGLIGEDEAGADPDGAGAHHESSSDGLAVGDAAGSDDLDGAAGEGRLVLVADLDNGGDEDGGGDVAGVAATLTTLGADDVDANVEALLDVLDVANHVHVENAVLVELVDNLLGGDTDGRDEDLGAGLDDDVDELAELALGVIVAIKENTWLVECFFFCL